MIVCGTTGKRKACKDCSCGLAEELSSENGTKIDQNSTQKSSCGSVSWFDPEIMIKNLII